MAHTNVALRHKASSFNGQKRYSYVGSVEIQGKQYVISVIADDDGRVSTVSGEYKGTSTKTVWCKVSKVDPNKPKRVNGKL